MVLRATNRSVTSRLSICAALLGATLPASIVVADQPAAARAAYDEGQTLAGQKRFAEAAQKFEQATAAEPGFAPGWYGLALAERRANNCAGAIPAYRRYAELRPDDAEPYYGLGLCLRDTGDKAGALAVLKKFVAIERRPTQARWIENARGLITTLEAATAAAVTPAAPSRGAPAYADAQRLRDSGQIDAALTKFAEAAALDPDLMVSRAAWGELLIKVHRDAEAVAVFRAALDRNAQHPLIVDELAFTLRETGKLADAVDAYRRYILLRPNDPDPYYGLARTLGRLGRGDDALRSYETYVSMEKRPSEGRFIANAQAEIAALKGRSAAPAGGAAPTQP
jgi:predicted Zn-dependent protease